MDFVRLESQLNRAILDYQDHSMKSIKEGNHNAYLVQYAVSLALTQVLEAIQYARD